MNNLDGLDASGVGSDLTIARLGRTPWPAPNKRTPSHGRVRCHFSERGSTGGLQERETFAVGCIGRKNHAVQDSLFYGTITSPAAVTRSGADVVIVRATSTSALWLK